MRKNGKGGHRPAAAALVIGRKGFAKISEVEGIRLTAGMNADFRSFDLKKLSATARRVKLSRKFGHLD